ncbi:MAG: GAF domain-containing protein [Dehalococcoidales bacterium]|nr:GAF domain-containing protein [Dehalococcoidales bacterium]
MNILHYIPAISAVLYIVLFVVTALNRPLTRQHRLFLLALVPAAVWSITDFLLRSPFWPDLKLLLLKLVIISSLFWVVQLYYFCRGFLNQPKDIWLYFGYALIGVNAVLFALNVIPPGVSVDNWKVHPVYGSWILLWIGPMALFAILGLLMLAKRLVKHTSPEERNKLGYLLSAIGLLSIFGIPSVAPQASNFSMGSIACILCASTLAYAVIRHDLINYSVFLRRLLGWGALFILSISIFETVQIIGHFTSGLEITPVMIASSSIGTLAVTAILFWLRPFILEKIDQLFYRQRYQHRRELFDFISHKMQGVQNLRELGEGLLSPLVKSLDCRQAHLLLPDKYLNHFVVRFSEPPADVSPPFQIRNDSPIINYLHDQYLTRKDLDIQAELRGVWSSERTGLSSSGIELLFPLLNRGNMVGILAFEKKLTGKYSTEDAGLIASIADQVAVTLEKERFQSELAKREKELSIINRLTRIVTSSLNIRDVFGAFVRGLQEAVDIDFASIGILEKDNLSLSAVYSQGPINCRLAGSFPVRGSGMEWIVLSKKTSIYPGEKSEDATFIDHLMKSGAASIVCLPLITRDEVIGILTLASSRVNVYSRDQVRFLEQLAYQISTSVVNSQLFSRTQSLYKSEKILRQNLEKEIKKRADFFRALVHELKTPLTPIVVSSETMLDFIQEETLKNLVRNVYNGAVRLNSRVDELLDISRGELGMLRVNLEPVDPLPLLEEVVRYIQPQLDNKRQSLVLEIPSTLPTVLGDESRLRQVLLNLLGNSMKFTPEDGQITVTTSVRRNDLVVSVRDTGKGIDKSEQDKLFIPYNQIGGDKETFSGLGLGLALCKQFVELHQGRIWVESQKGRGSTFSFTLPLIAQPAVSCKTPA